MVGWLLAGLATGIVWMLMAGWAPAAGVAVAAAAAAVLCRRNLLAATLLWLAAGIVLTASALTRLPAPEPYFGREVVMELKWTGSQPMAGPAGFQWEASVEAPPDLAGGRVRVRTEEPPCYGSYLVKGTLVPPVRYRNPGQQWHYRRLLWGGHVGQLDRAQVLNLWPEAPGPLQAVRGYYRNNIAELYGGDAAGLALAITTGERNLLEWQQRVELSQSGLGHVTALSGMHIGVLAGLALALLAKVGVGPAWSRVLVAAVLAAYVVFAGVRPSLLRAVLMCGYSLASYVVAGRSGKSIAALGWAVLAMLCYNPLWLADYSFLFSVAATACAVGGSGRLEGWLDFLPAAARRIAGLTLAIQVVTLPLALLLFGGVPTLAVAANLVAIPLLPVVFAATLAAGFVPAAAWPLAGAAAWLCHGLLELARQLSRGWLEMPVHLAPLAWVGALAAVGLWLGKFPRRKLAAAAVALVVAMAAGQWAYARVACSLWVLDVGHGDAVLIRCRGQWVLVDCGDEYAGANAVVPTLRRLGARRLAAVIITHPHRDHAGGLAAVLDAIDVRQVVVNDCFAASPWSEGVDARVVRHGQPLFSWLKVTAPGQWDPLRQMSVNDRSLVVTLDLNGAGALLAGDIEAEAEGLLAPVLGPHAVLKVAHHGSSTSSGAGFLNSLRPDVAIISCGLASVHGFPHQQVLANLEQAGADVYRTDRDGYVQIVFWPRGRYGVFTFSGR